MRHQAPVLLLATALPCGGCGGGVPLLHPAHALPVDTVTAGAGVSGNFVLGDAGEAIDGAVVANSQQGAAIVPEQQEEFFRGGFAYTLITPGLAPWVGARVGLGMNNEAGATYTARSIRVDARHALQGESLAASVGLGGTGHLMRPGSDRPVAPGSEATVGASGTIPGLDEGNVTGWGLDLPLLVGWRSTPALVQLWAGLRGGFELLWGDYVWQFSSGMIEEAKMEGKRWHAGRTTIRPTV